MMDTENDILRMQRMLQSIKEGNLTDEVTSNILIGTVLNESKETTPIDSNEHDFDQFTTLIECVSRNEACQEMLDLVESNVLSLLSECKAEQIDVKENINAVLSGQPPCNQRSTYWRVFGIPYFKDQSFYPAPPNQDFLEKQKLGYLNDFDVHTTIRVWNEKEKEILEHSIRNCEVQSSVEKNERMIQRIELKIKEASDISEIERLTAQTKEYKLNIITSKASSISELVGSRRDEYDWLKISHVDLKGFHSADECRAMWFNYLHPEINKTKWRNVEDKKLKTLAEEHKYQDWETIANELSTNRSGYQCMCHFQMRLNDTIKSGKWTAEEDELLEDLVSRLKIGKYIPWGKVTWHMNGRPRSQIYQRWTYTINPDVKKGRFTKDEDMMLIAGIRNFGMDFARIAQYFPGRTTVQVRLRIHTLLEHQSPSGPWTTEEDLLLLKLSKKYGNNWKQASLHFTNRTNNQIRCRYGVLKRWLVKNPKKDISQVVSRDRTVKTCDMVKIWPEVKNFVKKDNLHGTKNKTCNSEVGDEALCKLKNVFPKGKVGRKLGQKKVTTPIDLQYISFFRCAYTQRGGKSKATCSSVIVPELSRQTKLMLYLMKANLDFPSNSNAVLKDDSLVTADKCVLKFLIDNKFSGTHNIYKNTYISEGNDNRAVSLHGHLNANPQPRLSLGTETCLTDSKQHFCRDVIYMCPPSYSTLLGFRTLLLSRRNLRTGIKSHDQRKKRNINVAESRPVNEALRCSAVKAKVEEAERLWNERLASLFTWPALMSNIFPKALDDLYSDVNLASRKKKTIRNTRNQNCDTAVSLSNNSGVKGKSVDEVETQNRTKRRNIQPPQEVKQLKLKQCKSRKTASCTAAVRRSSRIISKQNLKDGS